MRRAAAIITVILCAIAAAAAVVLLRGIGGRAPVGGAAAPAVIPAPARARAPFRIGVVADDLAAFAQASGAYPSIDVKYLQWGSPFPSAAVLKDHGLGVTLMIVLEPGGTSLPGIAAGRDSAYLGSWTAADRKLGLPVMLSFAPEANGDWYPWGARHIAPSLYRAMWRTVHREITAGGGARITWVWQVNTGWPGSEPLSVLWPGNGLVDEVGIDSQMTRPADTFTAVFGATLSQVRAVTRKPVMISEVSVAAGPSRAAQITSLFRGAARQKLAAVILFDIYPRWKIDNDPAALAAFRAAVRQPG
jgi:hypothetical protein